MTKRRGLRKQEKKALDKTRQERNAALLSMDRETIIAWAEKTGGMPPAILKDEELFWVGVHKVRTLLSDLPAEARRESKTWLEDRGYLSLDAGTIPPEEGNGS